jgi:hypothetical protein
MLKKILVTYESLAILNILLALVFYLYSFSRDTWSNVWLQSVFLSLFSIFLVLLGVVLVWIVFYRKLLNRKSYYYLNLAIVLNVISVFTYKFVVSRFGL